MQQLFLGRQPVFDRDYQVCAYRLFFRPHGGADAGGDAGVTAKILTSLLMDIGLDRIAGDRTAFIRLDRDFLLNDASLPELLPAERVAIEVDAAAASEAGPMLKALKSQGYTVLLDDPANMSDIEPLIEDVDIVGLDVQAIANLVDYVRILRRRKVRLLAEKIASYEQFEQCKGLDFDFYQGDFFCRPDAVEGKRPPESKLAVLRALQRVLTAETLDQAHDAIKQDVGLSYRLLKYINSAGFGLRREVESIEQAMSLLGLNHLRRWLSLLALAALGEHKPSELVRTALYRGRFLESLAGLLGEANTGDDFMLGMFSVLDALLDQPMAQAIEDLSLPADVREALLDPSAPMAHKLALTKAMDTGDWDAVMQWQQKHPRVKVTDLTRIQIDAMAWADAQTAALGAE